MKVNVIELKAHYPVQGGALKCIAMETPWSDGHEDWKRPAVVIAPGGGYTHVSKREGEPIALAFLEKGFQAFILDYVCSPEARYPEQLIELASAVDYVKKHAKEYSVNPNEVFVIGFSAGGHLTANLAVEHQAVSEKAGVALDCKPTAVCLSYAAITEKGMEASVAAAIAAVAFAALNSPSIERRTSPSSISDLKIRKRIFPASLEIISYR